jgi:hypothetical protein
LRVVVGLGVKVTVSYMPYISDRAHEVKVGGWAGYLE